MKPSGGNSGAEARIGEKVTSEAAMIEIHGSDPASHGSGARLIGRRGAASRGLASRVVAERCGGRSGASAIGAVPPRYLSSPTGGPAALTPAAIAAAADSL